MNAFNIYVYENRSMSNDLSRPLMLENLNVDNVQIHIPKDIDGTDMGTWAWWLVYQNAKREKYSIPMTLEGVTNDEGEEEYISTVSLNHGFTGKHGTVMYAIEAVQADGSGAVTHEWHTRTYKLEIVHTLQGNQTEYSETESDIISALISRVNELITNGAEIAEIAETIERAAETAQEVIDSIPSDYSSLSSQVATNTAAIALKADQAATYTKGEVDQMIEDVEVETDTTLEIAGAPADAAETGRQIGLIKADLGAQVESIMESINESLGNRSTYHDSGDMYDLLAPLEVVSMKKTDKRIKYSSPPVEQNYTGWSIHYFDLSSLKYDSILVSCITQNWSSGFCYYNPSNGAYTALWKKGANQADWINLSSIPDGCYFCMTCEDTYYTTGYYNYLVSLWLSPEYTPKYEGLDESISDRAVKLGPNADMGALDQNRPYLAIDMTKYKDCVVRLATTASPSCIVRLYRTNELTTIGTSISNNYNSSLGNLFPWTYEEKYLVICFVTMDYSVFDNFDILFGWVNPEVARVNKQKRFWGPDLAAHNADSRPDLICACTYADLVDIDVCRTLDGYYVCTHDTKINGHTIAETNLEDLGLTHDQMEITESLEFLKKYGSFCYINFRETTVEQAAALMERIYNVLGRACIYSVSLIDQTSPIYGHAKKFYIWRANQQTMADIVQAGADPSKVYMFGASSGDYTEYDYIRTGSYTMSEVPNDGTVACAFINEAPLTAINGWNPS